MGRHFSIRRSHEGAKEPYLTDDEGNWRFYGPKYDATYEGLLRKLIHYAAGDPEAHWADQDRAADQAARASKAAGKPSVTCWSTADISRKPK
ncbi:hypothetical protein [Nannocystis pusilla]|uniref:hypothetical protein n=1 Tax=Nannocystis pusilla TaxID=889268 RepID=UPI003B80EE32